MKKTIVEDSILFPFESWKNEKVYVIINWRQNGDGYNVPIYAGYSFDKEGVDKVIEDNFDGLFVFRANVISRKVIQYNIGTFRDNGFLQVIECSSSRMCATCVSLEHTTGFCRDLKISVDGDFICAHFKKLTKEIKKQRAQRINLKQ